MTNSMWRPPMSEEVAADVIDRIQRLRARDSEWWTYRRLGARFGLSHERIWQILNPDAYKARKRKNRERKQQEQESGRSTAPDDRPFPDGGI